MAAPKGNKNAEKYTIEDARKFFDDCLVYAETTPQVYHWSKIARWKNTHKDIFDYLIKKFNNNVEFRNIKKQIATILEDNIVSALFGRKIPESAGIFALKCVFRWRDKEEVRETVVMSEDDVKKYVLETFAAKKE
jgi:hypothetical protein